MGTHQGGVRGTGSVLLGGVVDWGQLDPYGVACGGGRADIRLALRGDGEFYILSKSDGFVRKLISASGAAAQ
jgi:hypothetical protein